MTPQQHFRNLLREEVFIRTYRNLYHEAELRHFFQRYLVLEEETFRILREEFSFNQEDAITEKIQAFVKLVCNLKDTEIMATIYLRHVVHLQHMTPDFNISKIARN
jgi:hypothetical protein